MTQINRYARQARRAAVLAAVTFGLAASFVVPSASATTLAYSTATPMVLQNVTLADIASNRSGICHSTFTHVMKNFTTSSNLRNYLVAADKCGLKVIAVFTSTVNYTTGTVYPTRVAGWVNQAKDSPALWGYVSVKEPSWNRISAAEIRSLYKAYKTADPNHPVMAMFGDIPHFGSTKNPYTSGMADVVMVDWYPIETASNGCSRSGTHYVSGGATWYRTLVRPTVAKKTPGVPIWVMVQTHKNLAPSCHKKQAPTLPQLQREVREAFVYAGASGIAFHTFQNDGYTLDERRNPNMLRWMKLYIAGRVQAGTFH